MKDIEHSLVLAKSMSDKLAFLFPGQGSQSVGMGFDFAQENPDFMPFLTDYLRRADAQLGFSLSSIIQQGPAEELKKTEITQPALLTISSAFGAYWKAKSLSAHRCLGHSLGEYSALVYAEALRFEDAILIVHLRGKFMSEAVAHGLGGMAALMGASPEEAQRLCEKARGAEWVLEPSVFNSPGQIVISGHSAAIEAAEKLAPEFPSLRKITRLEVSGPFHCSLLEPAGQRLRSELGRITIQPPKIPVIFNVSAQTETQPEKIIDLLVTQVSKPVLWEASVRAARKEGCSDFREIGSGRVLSGLWKRID